MEKSKHLYSMAGTPNYNSLRHDSNNELLHDAIRMVFIELSKLDKILKKLVKK